MEIDDLDIEFCCAILKNEATQFLTNEKVRPEFLIGRGQEMYVYIKEHYGKYKQLPSLVTMKSELAIPDAVLARYYDDLDSVTYYANTIRDRACCREASTFEKRIKTAIRKGNAGDLTEHIRELFHRLLSLQQSARETSFIDWGAHARNRWKKYQKIEKIDGGIIGYRFPWEILTDRTQGMLPGNLIVIVASLGTGKTWTISITAEHLFNQFVPGCTEDDDSRVVVLYVTMEMIAEEIADRLDAIHSGLSFSALKRGKLGHDGRKAYKKALVGLDKHGRDRLYIADAGCISTVTDIEVMIARTEPHVVVVDGFYKLQTPGGHNRKREERVSDVVWDMKQMALRHRLPVLATTQYNREVAKREKKHKYKAGGAEGVSFSYTIFQDCDIGIGLYADEETREDNEMYVYLVKNRNDPGDLVFRCEWDLDLMEFGFIEEVKHISSGEATGGFDAGADYE